MEFWNQLLLKLKADKKAYLLTVVENFGSSPGRKGFKMFVCEDDFIFGSIGGGVMEFTLVEEVKTLLRQEQKAIFLKRQIHKGKIENGSGMICSGEQTVVFHPLDNGDVLQIERILSSLKSNKKGVLILSNDSINFELGNLNTQYLFDKTNSNNWCFKEQIGNIDVLYIVGGGHVGLAVSELFSKLGFYVVVFDDRHGLNTLENNAFANEKHIIDYAEISNYISQSSSAYVAIMTNKYTEDKLVLSKLIRNNYNFLGVLGSKAKLKIMYQVLEEKDGFSKEELSHVKGPIGLSISSQTPYEIAVSIAAQIIAEKNQS